jgi:hypothetical protein
MAKDNTNTIGAVEKRELAKLIDAEFNKIISHMQQEVKFTEGEILEQAEKKFGVKCINKEIKQLKEKIDMLEKRKSDMGFDTSHYGNGFKRVWDNQVEVVDSRTKAGKFFYLKMARNIDIQNLEAQRDSRLKSLWLTDSRSEVKQLAEKKPDIKLLSKPKDK